MSDLFNTSNNFATEDYDYERWILNTFAGDQESQPLVDVPNADERLPLDLSSVENLAGEAPVYFDLDPGSVVEEPKRPVPIPNGSGPQVTRRQAKVWPGTSQRRIVKSGKARKPLQPKSLNKSGTAARYVPMDCFTGTNPCQSGCDEEPWIIRDLDARVPPMHPKPASPAQCQAGTSSKKTASNLYRAQFLNETAFMKGKFREFTYSLQVNPDIVNEGSVASGVFGLILQDLISRHMEAMRNPAGLYAALSVSYSQEQLHSNPDAEDVTFHLAFKPVHALKSSMIARQIRLGCQSDNTAQMFSMLAEIYWSGSNPFSGLF